MTAQPDRLAYVIGAHVLRATPGLRVERRWAPGAMVQWIADFLDRRNARLQLRAGMR